MAQPTLLEAHHLFTAGRSSDLNFRARHLRPSRLFHLQTAYEFGELFDFPLWGNFTYSSSPGQARNFSFQSGASVSLRYNFVMQHALADIVDSDYRPSGMREPAFAYAHDFGSATSGMALYTIGSVQQPIMR